LIKLILIEFFISKSKNLGRQLMMIDERDPPLLLEMSTPGSIYFEVPKDILLYIFINIFFLIKKKKKYKKSNKINSTHLN
jgi:hypothetical protein